MRSVVACSGFVVSLPGVVVVVVLSYISSFLAKDTPQRDLIPRDSLGGA